MPTNRRPGLACATVVASALHACASAPAPRQARLDDAFARIQVAEARIEHARADVARPDSACSAVHAASDRAGAASAELCTVAREAADPDALVRCEQGERSARSIELQADRRCARGSAP